MGNLLDYKKFFQSNELFQIIKNIFLWEVCFSAQFVFCLVISKVLTQIKNRNNEIYNNGFSFFKISILAFGFETKLKKAEKSSKKSQNNFGKI